MTHPYRNRPERAFWAKSVARRYQTETLCAGHTLIRADEKIASAGSCFAANIVPYLEKAGFEYVRTERLPSVFGALTQDNFSYQKFSASYGNIYTARQARQLIERALGMFTPKEDRWYDQDGTVIDPFRPGLRFRAQSDAEFDTLIASHLERVLDTFRQCDVFVFTLGLTEAWRSKADGAVFPACPGTVAGQFSPDAHEFVNFCVAEVVEDLNGFIELARTINPDIRFVLTVSPVPLVATATDDHVLNATIYSKSVLRVAAGEVANHTPDVTYFPAYEIITGPQAPYDYFQADRREPSEKAIRQVMRTLLSQCATDYVLEPEEDAADQTEGEANTPSAPASEPENPKTESASEFLSRIECEEAAAGH